MTNLVDTLCQAAACLLLGETGRDVDAGRLLNPNHVEAAVVGLEGGAVVGGDVRVEPKSSSQAKRRTS